MPNSMATKRTKSQSNENAAVSKAPTPTVQNLRYLELPSSAPQKSSTKPTKTSLQQQYPVGVVIRQTNLAFRNALNERLKEKKVTPAQWVFLRILWNEDALNQKDLAQRVGVQQSTAVPAITILERNGYVRRERSDKDKRNVTVRLTEQGQLLAKQLIPVALEQNRKALEGVSNEDADKLMELLLKIQTNLGSLGSIDEGRTD